MNSCSAKAMTPFGPLAGRSILRVDRDAEDLVTISFTVGATPVSFSVADSHLDQFIRDLIAATNTARRSELLDALEAAS